jgi:hypothetical protein
LCFSIKTLLINITDKITVWQDHFSGAAEFNQVSSKLLLLTVTAEAATGSYSNFKSPVESCWAQSPRSCIPHRRMSDNSIKFGDMVIVRMHDEKSTSMLRVLGEQKVGKTKVYTRELIGQPYGSVFQVRVGPDFCILDAL